MSTREHDRRGGSRTSGATAESKARPVVDIREGRVAEGEESVFRQGSRRDSGRAGRAGPVEPVGEWRKPTAEIDVAALRQRARQLEVRGAAFVVLSGANSGQEIRLESSKVLVGRDPACGLCLPDEGVSWHHARVELADDGRWAIEDLGSTNGTVVNGERVERQTVRDGDRLLFGSTVLKFLAEAAVDQEYRKQAYEQSVRDELTKLYNRRFFNDRLRAELAYARRHRTHLSVLMIDIDRFKAVNDRHGHPAGDAVLRQVAAEMERRIRAEDILVRFGGEEFCLLARGIPPEGAAALGERMRTGVERLVVLHESTNLQVTVSVGAATAEGSAELTGELLVSEADRLLYAAKAGGRNRTCAAVLSPRATAGAPAAGSGSARTPGNGR